MTNPRTIMNENSQIESANVEPEESIGSRLRRAREGMGISTEELAARLHVPLELVRDAERDCFDRLGAEVYVRGYLRATCRALSLSEQLAADYRGVVEPPALQPMRKASLLERLLERSARSLVYIVLTASIGIPVLWFALRSPQNAVVATTPLTQLDPVPVAPPDSAVPAAREGDSSPAPPASVVATPTDDQPKVPVVASLSGFLDAPSAAVPRSAPAAAAAVPVPKAGSLVLSFQSESWLEVRDFGGRLLDEVLARPGDERSYPLGAGMHVVLGNAGGVRVRIDERNIDLKPYQRANVARFAVSSRGEVASDRD